MYEGLNLERWRRFVWVQVFNFFSAFTPPKSMFGKYFFLFGPLQLSSQKKLFLG
jgi:hypothetical protein